MSSDESDQTLNNKIETNVNKEPFNKVERLIAQRGRDLIEARSHYIRQTPRQYNVNPSYGELVLVPRDYIKGNMYGKYAAHIPYDDPLSLLQHPLAIELGIQVHQIAITKDNSEEIKKTLEYDMGIYDVSKVGRGIIAISDTYIAALDSQGQLVVIYLDKTGSVVLNGSNMTRDERIKVARATIASEFGKFVPARSRSYAVMSPEISKDLHKPSLKDKSLQWLSSNWKCIVVISLSVAAGYYIGKKS